MYVFIIILTIILISNINADVSIGGNLDGLRDGGHSLPYVNLIRQSRKWGSPFRPSDENATYDPITGWPTSDFDVVIISNSFDLGGTYLLHAKGNAQVSMADELPGLITNKTYDLSTNTLSAFIILPQNSSQMRLSFRHTTGPGSQNISILQSGYNLSSQFNITTLMLTHLSRFNIIRFMEWTRTNNNSDVHWNETPSINWPQYTIPKYNPWETIPQIINQLNKSTDIWINIPFHASDDYILNLAKLMFKQIKSDINIYIEYFNEVWNYLFPQATVNLLAANNSVYYQGDPLHLNYDNITNPEYWAYRRIASQIKHIAELFQNIFGKENVGQWKRIRPILDYVNTVYGSSGKFLHGIALALAPYINLGKYKTWSNLTVDQVLDGLNSSLQTYLPEQGWNEQAPVGVHAIYAAWYGLVVHGYEGGIDTAAGCGNCSLEAKKGAIRNDRLTDLCLRYLNGWYRYGFQTLNWFVAGASQTTSTGSWGLLEDMRQEILLNTTIMFNSTSPVAQLPRPSPKYHHPDLRNFKSNSTFFYPLQIHQSSIQINLTVYVAGKSGILEASINNANFLRIKTPSTGNSTIFQPTSVMQFNISQTILPSIVTLRLKNIVNGYSIRSFDVILTKPTI